jgi:DNA repair protein RadC
MSEREPSPPAPYRTIRELADDERPRERLLRHGAEVLSDTELIALVLGSGMPGENVLDLARRVLESAGGLPGLLGTDPAAMQRIRGLGPAKAALLAAAVELGRRAGGLEPESRPLLTTPELVFAFLGARLRGRPTEQLHVLSLDVKGRLLGGGTTIDGSVSAISTLPVEVFREPIVLRATSVILVHNHPSGDARPSPQDVAVTQKLAEAAAILQLSLLDHVIIGQNSYISMKREGYPLSAGRAGRK